MANALNDPTKWRDLADNQPPEWWDGSAYTWSAGRNNWFAIQLMTASSGDTVAGRVSFDGQGDWTEDRCLNWIVGGEVKQSWPLAGGTGVVDFSAPAEVGMLALANFADQGYPTQQYAGTLTIEPAATAASYNCECDEGQPTVTLQDMRNRLARRLGFAVQVSMGALPPGMPELLDDFIRSAHDFMYHRYSVMRLRRMFTWDLAAGVRFYDVDGNVDGCPRVLNPDRLEWVGISQGDSSWQPLICGINPVLYGSAMTGIPSHYEIRQCIEIWPAPADDSWKLRIKGDFGPSPVEADGDVLTVDPEAVFLHALANAKAHYGQADAGNYASQATAYVRSKVAGAHQTRRYIPGSCPQPPAVRPVLKEN